MQELLKYQQLPDLEGMVVLHQLQQDMYGDHMLHIQIEDFFVILHMLLCQFHQVHFVLVLDDGIFFFQVFYLLGYLDIYKIV